MPLRNLVILAICAVIAVTCHQHAARSRLAGLFAEVVELVGREYVRPEPPQKLFDASIRGMLAGLDEHSTYLSDRELQVFDENIDQQFGGVGMYVQVDRATGFLKVGLPMPDTPAFRAGLRSGDLILAINGESTENRPRSQSIEQMRGPVGSPVRLAVRKTDDTEMELTLLREVIPVTSVFGDTTNPDGSRNFKLADYPRIGYLRLDQFGMKTVEEVRAALGTIAGRIDGLIIDLRQNSGGPLQAAVDICDMFLGEGKVIVETIGRDQRLISRHVSHAGTAIDPAIPLAVLVDRGSASASEIVAACLQDHGRAVIVGERSYGKGTVQNVYPLQRNRSAIKLTTAGYWPPSGRPIDRHDPAVAKTGLWGVPPSPGLDVELTEDEVFAVYLQRQQRELTPLVDGKFPDQTAIPVPSEDDGDEVAPPAGGRAVAPVAPVEDRTLQKAIQWLREHRPVRSAPEDPVAARAG